MADANKVILTVPVLDAFARTVRITAAELAARAEMPLDHIEDVRLAVEEAFVFASERASEGSLTFEFEVGPGFVALEVSPLLTATPDAVDPGERYARFILEAICDEFEMIRDTGSCRLRIVKRSS